MILKGSQRGGASQLAAHLLKTEDNEHVEIHEISGFVSEDVYGALKEIQAVSQGTRCKQYMFSLSLNPPEKESVPVEHFEGALLNVEKDLNLAGQPRVVLFHEKEGRRHCHAVYSRIDSAEMKAINLPYFKNRLQDISRQLYFQHGWEVPRGLRDKRERNPLNFTLAEWQQAKRLEEDPKAMKKVFLDCWAVSDYRRTFEQALKNYGMFLAKGDRRGFVAIDYHGEVYSLSRWTNVKTKELRNRLGDPNHHASIKEIKTQIAERMTKRLRVYIREVQTKLKQQIQPFLQKKQGLITQHRHERQRLKEKQEARLQSEALVRSRRLPKGLLKTTLTKPHAFA